jgi:hypothetical protein
MNTYDYQITRSITRKYHLISLRGGKCEKCGYNHNLAAFDFHHRDPSTKKFQLDQRTLSNNSMKVILEEFEKCDVLCANCHREHHSPNLSIDKVLDFMKSFDENKNDIILIKDKKEYKCEDCSVVISKWGKKCKSCFHLSRRKTIRPDLEVLKEKVESLGYSKTSKEFGVSDKTIKKWLGYSN